MADINISGNKNYIEINGRVYADPDNSDPGIFVSSNITPNTDEVDMTSGSGQDYKKRDPGLTEFTLEAKFLINEDRWIQDISNLTNGVGHAAKVMVDFGRGGKRSGLPRHRGMFLVQLPTPDAVEAAKTPFAFTVNGMSDGTPEYIEAIDTWP